MQQRGYRGAQHQGDEEQQQRHESVEMVGEVAVPDQQMQPALMVLAHRASIRRPAQVTTPALS
jgi:hypothetical protein